MAETLSQLDAAVSEMEASPSVRFFLRYVLSACGALPQQSVFSPDVAQNAFEQGRQAAGIFIVSLLTERSPNLWLTLQAEEMVKEDDNAVSDE